MIISETGYISHEVLKSLVERVRVRVETISIVAKENINNNTLILPDDFINY